MLECRAPEEPKGKVEGPWKIFPGCCCFCGAAPVTGLANMGATWLTHVRSCRLVPARGTGSGRAESGVPTPVKGGGRQRAGVQVIRYCVIKSMGNNSTEPYISATILLHSRTWKAKPIYTVGLWKGINYPTLATVPFTSCVDYRWSLVTLRMPGKKHVYYQ